MKAWRFYGFGDLRLDEIARQEVADGDVAAWTEDGQALTGRTQHQPLHRAVLLWQRIAQRADVGVQKGRPPGQRQGDVSS